MNDSKFNRMTHEQRAAIVRRYEAGELIESLLKDVPWYRLQQFLDEFGVQKRRKRGRRCKVWSEQCERAVIQRYLSNEPTTTLHRDVSYLDLNRILQKYKIPKRKRLSTRTGSIDRGQFIIDIKNGTRLRQLMKKYDISRQRIHQICKKLGLKRADERTTHGIVSIEKALHDVH